MISIHALGFPRMGAQRELKHALERHWRGDIDEAALEAVGRELRQRHWQLQAEADMSFVTVGDFAFYDHGVSHIQMLGCEPARFAFGDADSDLQRCFAMARGGAAANRRALEMTKWFDTNYHYLVPEFHADTTFALGSRRLIDEVHEARALGHRVKAVILGPLSFLWLGKARQAGLDRLDLLERLLPAYAQLLEALKAAGAEWVQVDEPILGLDLPAAWRQAFEPAYHRLHSSGLPLLLATYFSPLGENLGMACRLPVSGLHVDAVRAPEELGAVIDWLPRHKVLSVGVVDGRNIWRTDLDRALELLQPVLARREGAPLWLGTSCSLLHVPFSLRHDEGLDDALRDWTAGACEKLHELRTLGQVLQGRVDEAAHALQASRAALAARAASARVHRPDVARRVAQAETWSDRRSEPFEVRQALQQQRWQLPAFPTTTIGSFPQTPDIRGARAAWRQGHLSDAAYEQAMQREIAQVIEAQEALGLDVLVHGEAERNDMVEYFGEQLQGYAFTRHGWVQSYGSRCVKPPIVYGDVCRPEAMTVSWAVHAQSLTDKPVKGMLTGPITLLQWSFVRDDQPRETTALQIALAIRDEVQDLEAAGIGIIQIDEPALREGLPLRHKGWAHYLDWASRAFRLTASGVQAGTQIHTHMCYCEFNDILPEIAALDADVITIETSRSDMDLLRGFGQFQYPNQIGPGVYDIHSPRVPSREEMVRLLRKAAAVVPASRLWVNPDCGLKTRQWPETRAALQCMVEAAQELRRTLTEEVRSA